MVPGAIFCPLQLCGMQQKASAAGEGKLCLSEEFPGPRVECVPWCPVWQFNSGQVAVQSCLVLFPLRDWAGKFPFLLSAHGDALQLAPLSKRLSHPVAS